MEELGKWRSLQSNTTEGIATNPLQHPRHNGNALGKQVLYKSTGTWASPQANQVRCYGGEG